MTLVSLHVLLDVGHLSPVLVQLQLVQTLLLLLADVSAFGVFDGSFEHVAVHVRLTLVDGVNKSH